MGKRIGRYKMTKRESAMSAVDGFSETATFAGNNTHSGNNTLSGTNTVSGLMNFDSSGGMNIAPLTLTPAANVVVINFY